MFRTRLHIDNWYTEWIARCSFLVQTTAVTCKVIIFQIAKNGTTGGAKRRRRRLRGVGSGGGRSLSDCGNSGVSPLRFFLKLCTQHGEFWVNPKRHSCVETSCWASHMLDHWWVSRLIIFSKSGNRSRKGTRRENGTTTASRLMSEIFRDKRRKRWGCPRKKNWTDGHLSQVLMSVWHDCPF